jgi:hypothetical protein
MSNTYKDKRRGKYNRIEIPDYNTSEWHRWVIKKEWEAIYGYRFYSKNAPGWWDNLFHERPMRRKVKKALQKVTLENMGEDVMLPVLRKPNIYYW